MAVNSRKTCQKDYNNVYLKRHMTICPLALVTEQSTVGDPLLDTQISCFYLNENPDVEMTYSQIHDNVFFFGKKYYEYDTSI